MQEAIFNCKGGIMEKYLYEERCHYYKMVKIKSIKKMEEITNPNRANELIKSAREIQYVLFDINAKVEYLIEQNKEHFRCLAGYSPEYIGDLAYLISECMDSEKK